MPSIGYFFAANALVGLAACAAAPGSAVEDGVADPVETETSALSVSALTKAQSKAVLHLVDDICGDTWCDGDYDFGFRRLSCNHSAGTCTLTLQVFPREGVPSAARSYWRSCKTLGFDGFDSLVTTTASGYQSLNGDYYDALTECISRIEAKIR